MILDQQPTQHRALIWTGWLIAASFWIGVLLAGCQKPPTCDHTLLDDRLAIAHRVIGEARSECLDVVDERDNLRTQLEECEALRTATQMTVPVYQRVGTPVRGIASWMCHDGDKWCGRGSKCKLPPLDGDGPDKPRRIVDTDHVFASRAEFGIECGETIEICNPRTALCTYARRGTSGPFGAMLDGEWVIKISNAEPGEWRGILDLTTSVKNAIDHNGFERVVMHRLDHM